MKTKPLICGILLAAGQPLWAALPPGYVVGWGADICGTVTGVPHYAHTNGVVCIAGQPITNAVAVAAGYQHGLALRSDGTVVGWGLNSSAQATGTRSTIPDTTNGVVAIDGRALDGIVEIAAGWGYSLGVRSNGTVVDWGRDNIGAKKDMPAGLNNVVSVAAGMIHSVALKNDGTVVGWPESREPAGLTNTVAIAADREGFGGVLALKRDGTVVTWNVRGIRDFQQEKGVSNAVAIAIGGWQELALMKDGTVTCIGNQKQLPAGLSNIVAIAVGQHHSLALKGDGTVQAWGQIDSPVSRVPEGLSNVVAIAAGDEFSLALTTNRAVAEKFRH